MKTTRLELIHRLSELETKVLDPILFQMRRDPQAGEWIDDGEENHSLLKTAGGIAGAGVAGAAALPLVGESIIAHGMLKNRVSGLRSTVPGFAQKSRIGQYASAAGDLAKPAAADALAATKKAGAKVGASLLPLLKKGASRLRGLRFGSELTGRVIALSAKVDEKLVEFRGGFVNTGEGVKKERGAGGHFTRNAGAYLGTAIFPGVGTAAGLLIDGSRKRKNKLRTQLEPKLPAAIAAQVAK